MCNLSAIYIFYYQWPFFNLFQTFLHLLDIAELLMLSSQDVHTALKKISVFHLSPFL